MSNVTHSTFGNHRGPREPGDLERYPTPPIAVTGLLGVETIAPRVLNPCGTDDDAITTVLRAAGRTVSTNDVAAGGVDFMTVTTLPADCIVMNAPFTRSADFRAARAGDRCAKGLRLQRLGWLETGRFRKTAIRRGELFRMQRLERIWVFADRLPRMHRADWCGKVAKATLNCAWFIFTADHYGKAETDWIWGD